MTRRKPAVPRFVVASAVIAVALLSWLAFASERGPGSPGFSPAVEDGAVAAVAGSRTSAALVSRSAGAAPTPVLATVEGLELVMPHPDPVAVAFHESGRAEALALEPASDGAAGAAFQVLEGENGTRLSASTAAIAVPAGKPVTAPVTGNVADIIQYPLTGTDGDVKLLLRPEGHRGLLVEVAYLREVQVRRGDRVRAGKTTLGTARQLPVRAPVDQLLDDPAPHVRVEVRAALEPAPVDPNAPALPADATP